MPDQPDETENAVAFSLTVASLQRALPAYRIVREVGAGAMGTVFEAEDPKLGRRVAIKVLQPGATKGDQRRLRFQREGTAIARLSHPNIVPIHTIGETGELHYFVMGFIDGPPVSDVIRQDGHIPYRRTFRIIRQAVEALDEAHRNGIIHRDFKPQNLLLQEGDRVVLTDFGLARPEGTQTMTETGAILGTPMYMAPEQILGDKDKIDGRADLYAVGATLYQMLTGSMPFTGESTTAVLRSVLDKPPIPFTRSGAAGHHVPRDAQKIVLKLLNKRASDRYSSARELLADIDRLLEGIPVEASLPGMITRMRRGVAKHPLPSAIVAVIALVAAVAVLRTGKHAQEVEQEAKEAVERKDDEIRTVSRARDLTQLASSLQATLLRLGSLWTREDQLTTAIAEVESELASPEVRELMDPTVALEAEGEETLRREVVELAYPFLSALYFYRGLVESRIEDLERSIRLCGEALRLHPGHLGLKLQSFRSALVTAMMTQPRGDPIAYLSGVFSSTQRIEDVVRFGEQERLTARYKAFFDYEKRIREQTITLALLTASPIGRITQSPRGVSGEAALRARAMRALDAIVTRSAALDPATASPYLLRERARALWLHHQLRGAGPQDEQLGLAAQLIRLVKDQLPTDPHTQFLLSQIAMAQGGELIRYIKIGEEAIRDIADQVGASGARILFEALPILAPLMKEKEGQGR